MQIEGISSKAVISGLALWGFAIIMEILALIMIARINQKLEPDKRLGYFRWDRRIRDQFRQLYPDSKLHILVRLCDLGLFLSIGAVTLWVLDP